MKELYPRKDAPLLGVPTQVGTSDYRKFRQVSGLSGSLKKPAWVSRVIPMSGVPTQVGTSNRPNKKPCSDLAFWIPIRTVPNSWENWKIRLGEVSYRNKTTPFLYMRGSWPIEIPSIQSSKIQHINSFCPNSPLSTPPAIRQVSPRDLLAS